MDMTQKGSRSIVVDGVCYRWMVRPKPTYMQEVFACPHDVCCGR